MTTPTTPITPITPITPSSTPFADTYKKVLESRRPPRPTLRRNNASLNLVSLATAIDGEDEFGITTEPTTPAVTPAPDPLATLPTSAPPQATPGASPTPAASPTTTGAAPAPPATHPAARQRRLSAPNLQPQSPLHRPVTRHRRRLSAPGALQTPFVSHGPPRTVNERAFARILAQREATVEDPPEPRTDDIVVSLALGSYNENTILPSPFYKARARQVLKLKKILGLKNWRFWAPTFPPHSRAPGPGCTIYAYVPPASVVGAMVLDSGHLKRLITHFAPLDKEFAAYQADHVSHAPRERNDEFLSLENRAKLIQSSRHYSRFATTLGYRRVLSSAVDTLYTGFLEFGKERPRGLLDRRRSSIEYAINQPQPHNPVGHKHEAHGHEHHHHAHPHHEHHDPNSHPQKTAEFQAENAAAHAKPEEKK
ncbi:uncharacterized protein LOC62_01G000121 [Vanrija pseudolonga]|uniref:Uncharacterized protein n=1 Tax=Vanrija pseudolonga TaxID=143232 RepID=A0AAF1BMA7_9TREE|nr:hypothetical protein LOC62_01G000121 [Vanrija pseudolonga]